MIIGKRETAKEGTAPGKYESFIWIALVIIFVVLFIADIFVGSVRIEFNDILKTLFSTGTVETESIIMQFRLPKAMTALLVGSALSISGLQMQTVFRNPMAGPYVLGISSGASLGVAFVIIGFPAVLSVGFSGLTGPWALAVASWIGAGTVMLIIMLIASKIRDILTVLILGIMLSSGISALVSIMQYFSNESMLKAYVIWTMGSLGNLTGPQLNVLAITVVFGTVLSFLSAKMLNALLIGENYASTLGVNLKLARIVVFSGTSILAGSVTAFCGPIGFIGIAVPHIARIILGTSDHRKLIPAVVITGSIIMLLSDIVSQLPGSDRVLPVNSVTSFIGIPVVIWVILRNKKLQGASL
jgi:iron complex transport system permease protein